MNIKKVIEGLVQNRRALGCFNVINYESLVAALRAAEKKNSPVCLTIHPPHFKYFGQESFIVSVKDAAEKANIPVVLHLDNAEEIEQIINAIKYGFTSLMYIGKSNMSYDQKIRNTKLAAEIAHYADLLIESDVPYDDSNRKYIEDIIDFIKKTNIDIVSANIIKMTVKRGQELPDIDFNLLKNIKEETGKYISLHGGSNVPRESIEKAIVTGLDKMHIFGKSAELSLIKARYHLKKNDADIIELMHEIGSSFGEIVEKNIEIFGSEGTGETILKSSGNICVGDTKRIVEIITGSLLEKLKNS